MTCPNDTSICTLPEFVDNCRNCADPNQWRCNDGWCIDASRINDGVADCLDRSDEDSGTPMLAIVCSRPFQFAFLGFLERFEFFTSRFLQSKCCFVFRARSFLSARHYVIT